MSLNETLEAVLSQHSLKAQAKGLRLFSTIESGLPETMIGDGPRLQQMLSHLISNAIKFTHSGSVELRIGVEREARASCLVAEVCDTGIGIPPDRLDAIFESFRQVDSGLSRSYPGLGLGLALARKLAALMKGQISVVSVPGAGSTFTVRLPLRRPAESAHGNTAAPITGPMILVVEDNPVGVTVLRHSLERRSVRVETAMSGRAALEAAAKHRYDLILMDLQMPEMDGLETTARIRMLPGYERVPILALTANCSDELRERCLREGMQAFVSKPIEAKALWAVVSRFLS